MRMLGLDVGDKRIGVALSDPGGMIASALTVLNRSENASELEAITELVGEWEVEGIVVGLPFSMDGSEGGQAGKVREFCQMLSECVTVPVLTWDERLSTVAAERIMLDAGMKREKRKDKRDAIAAAITLQGYLDRCRFAIDHGD